MMCHACFFGANSVGPSLGSCPSRQTRRWHLCELCAAHTCHIRRVCRSAIMQIYNPPPMDAAQHPPHSAFTKHWPLPLPAAADLLGSLATKQRWPLPPPHTVISSPIGHFCYRACKHSAHTSESGSVEPETKWAQPLTVSLRKNAEHEGSTRPV